MERSLHAIIIGGGIGGATTAVALQRAGIRFTLYERAPEPREVGAGVALWGNAVHVLRMLDLAEPLLEIAGVMRYGELRTASGRVLSRQRVEDWDRALGEISVGVHRAELLGLLLRPLDPDCIHFDHRCVEVNDDGRRVRARFANGHADEGDLLVGADGLSSVVRATLHGDQPPRYSGYTCWRGIVQPPDTLIPAGHLCETWGRGRRFGFLSLGGQRVYWFATLNAPPNGRDSDGCAARASLLRLFGDWFGPPRALLEATPDDAIIRNDILDRPPTRNWGRGRLTLLGDAAHPTTPNLGQGACMAIEDALVLARALRPHAHAADSPAGVAEVLRLYERSRQARTAEVTRFSHRLGRVAQWSNPLLCALRDTLLAAMPMYAIRRSHRRYVGFRA